MDNGITIESVERKPRADAARNRERLIEVAKACFAEAGPEVSLEEVARRAGLGIGTLYRHFPTRDAIVEAVYRREVQQLADAAPQLLANRTPIKALAAWMAVFVDYIDTKKILASTLTSIVSGSAELQAFSGGSIIGAITLLIERGKAQGEVRADAVPMDILRALAGFTYGNSDPNWRESALRLIDIMVDGLRTSRA